MKEFILLIGGGGHCRSCIDVIEKTNQYQVCGIIDKKENIGEIVSGYPVLGSDDVLNEYIVKYKNALITIGQIKTSGIRVKLFNEIKGYGGSFPVIISPFAHVSNRAVIGEGTIVMHNCVINSGGIIGMNCIINTSAVIEHDVLVGNNSHISTGCVINGESRIGDNVFIGSNAVIRNGINICDSVVIGAGSVVLKSIIKKGIYAGNPLHKIG